jgi:ABC-type antimicrobial peptide transport system permease subunit
MLLRFQKAAVRGNYETGNQAFSMRLRFLTVRSGILAGLALALALNTILAKWAEGNSRDPIILVAGTLLLSLVSGIACAIPARHASEIDPMAALCCE